MRHATPRRPPCVSVAGKPLIGWPVTLAVGESSRLKDSRLMSFTVDGVADRHILPSGSRWAVEGLPRRQKRGSIRLLDGPGAGSDGPLASAVPPGRDLRGEMPLRKLVRAGSDKDADADVDVAKALHLCIDADQRVGPLAPRGSEKCSLAMHEYVAATAGRVFRGGWH